MRQKISTLLAVFIGLISLVVSIIFALLQSRR
jgi:hypothetical protein